MFASPPFLTSCACASFVAMAGCAQSQLSSSLAELARQDLGELHPSDQMRLERASGAAAPGKYINSIDEASPITVDDFVRLALDRNPAIAAASHRVNRLSERVDQVTSLDDPILSITPVGDMAQTATGEVQMMSGVSQRIPYPGKLDAKGRIAKQDIAMAEQERAGVRLAVIADTRRAYWSLYQAARSIEITQQSRELVIQLGEVARANIRTGRATQEAVLRASVELSNLDKELISLDQRRTAAVGMLNTLIDRPVDAPLADPKSIDITRFDAKLDDLLAIAWENNPGLQIVREQIGRFREQRQLAALGDRPDFTVGLSYNLVDDGGRSPVASGDDQWWISFGLSIPLWHGKTEAAKREATLGILETSSQLASKQNLLNFRIQDAFAKIDTQQRQAELLHDVIVPEASLMVEASLSGYRTGRVDFKTLIDNWRKLLEFQLMYQSSITALEQSFADLQEAVGHDLDREMKTPDSEPQTPETNGETNR